MMILLAAIAFGAFAVVMLTNTAKPQDWEQK
jgi:hypothetical protein